MRPAQEDPNENFVQLVNSVPSVPGMVKQNREVPMMKFYELDRDLAARTYDGMIGTFTTNGVVDEEMQKNDLDIVARSSKSRRSSHRTRLRFLPRKRIAS